MLSRFFAIWVILLAMGSPVAGEGWFLARSFAGVEIP